MWSAIPIFSRRYDTILELYEKGRVLERFREDMTSVLVHDLKNPLAVILTNIDFVRLVVQPVDADATESLDDIRMTSERMLRLLTNLLDLTRMEEGRLVPARELIPLEPRGGTLSFRAVENDDCVRLEIGNSGPAIPADAREAIFDKFGQSTTGGRLNIGLGLYFCRCAVEAHGGKIRVESHAALPTVFVIDLPRASSDSIAAAG